MIRLVTLFTAFTLILVVACAPARAEAPSGQMTWAVHTTLVPAWFDPAENIQVTPFMIQMATHDALVKQMDTELIDEDEGALREHLRNVYRAAAPKSAMIGMLLGVEHER